MEELHTIIAQNLRQLRQSRNLSLGQLAEMSGISKVMLSQMEKGSANPTINTIWKIANGLKVPYTALIDAAQEDTQSVSYAEAKGSMQYSADKKCCIYCYYPSTPIRNYELFGMELAPGGIHESPGHGEKAQEYIIIQQGELVLERGGKEHVLHMGDALHFPSDRPHLYRNRNRETTRVLIMNYYSL